MNETTFLMIMAAIFMSRAVPRSFSAVMAAIYVVLTILSLFQ